MCMNYYKSNSNRIYLRIMETIKFDFVLILIFISCLDNGWATVTQCRKEISTKGRHFIVTVPPMAGSGEFDCEVYISSEHGGQALITKHDGSAATTMGNYSLYQGNTTTLSLKGSTIRQINTGRQIRALEIVSTTDVAVYVAGTIPEATAAFVVFPTQLAAQHYIIPTYRGGNNYNYLLLTSLQNVTNIMVTNYSTNNRVNSTINKLESYTFKTSSDPTHAEVRSNKPVNIVVGNQCTSILHDSGSCDTLYDTPIPIRFWGHTFIVPPTTPKSDSLVRLYPMTESKKVTIEYSNTNVHTNISFQGRHEINLGTDPTVIISDQPIGVVQYGASDSYGDAFMTSVPAVSHYSSDYVFSTPFPDNGYVYRVAITIETKHLNGLLLDGSSVSALKNVGKWNLQARLERFSVVTIELPQGQHTLRHQSSNVRFSVLLYGYKHHYGFGFHLGFSFPIGENSCNNGGSCTGDGNCFCLPGYSGDSCEKNIDDCQSAPCQNFALCIDGTNDYTCRCTAGWMGKYCEKDIDECRLGAPCLNGGTCINTVGSYKCVCANGWTNNHCQTVIHTTPLPPSDLMCLSCEYSSSMSYCDSVQHCTGNEKCFIQRFTNQNGHTHYRSGCMDRQVCNQHIHNDQTGDTCLQCCEDSFCNRQGCGDYGYPPKESRGPYCLDCAHVSDPKECDQITVCSADELCRIEELPWGVHSIYHLGCAPIHDCGSESSSLGKRSDVMMPRSVPVCSECCSGDFCNRNCTRQGNSHHQIIVG